MKKRIISFFTALSMTLMLFTGIPISISAANGIAINATNFPDEKFINSVRKRDTDNDGFLSTEEIENTTSLSFNNVGLSDLKGIEFFTELTSLELTWNNLTKLDISKNTKLTKLSCRSNDLTVLDITQNTELIELDCGYNSLNSLDISKNTKLETLNCQNNQINELDVSQNTALTYLYCTDNQLSELGVSQNTALTFLNCSANQLNELDISNNTALKSLYCANNNLASIDVSKNTDLESFNCGNNQFTELDVSKNTSLTTLQCNNNQLTSLDISANIALTRLDCYENNLASLNVKNLDLSGNSTLRTLQCHNNQLTSLDVSQNTALIALICNNNQLTSLDVSNNTKITAARNFNCENNKYTVSCCMFDPAALPAGFALSNASNWTNAEITDDNKIFYLGTGNVTYTYDCGNGKTATFTLVFPSRDLTKVEAKDATCTEDGNIEYYKCSCGYKFKNENPAAADILSDEDVVTAATGHTLTAHDAVPADCTTDGNETYWTCSVCNKMFSDENGTTEITEIPTIPAEHKYSEGWESDNYEHWHECTVCGDKKDNASHAWNDGIVTKEPDEENEGEKTYTCTICSATKTESIDKLEHTHDWSNTYQFDSSQHWKVCTKCNEAGTKENHVWDSGTVTTPPTEEAEGVKTYTCTVCAKTKTENIAQLEHTHDWSNTYQSDSSQHWKVCTKCNEAGTKENHVWDSGTVTTQPTEDTYGVRTYTCTVCSATKTESIDKLEHTHDWSNTYQFDSSQHWKVCTKCNEAGTKENHVWDSGTVTTPPTEDTYGVRTYTCTVCSATKTESIDKLAHTHTYSTEWTKDETYHWHAATCGHDVVSERAAHTEDGGTVTVPATTENDGLKTYACSVCGYVMRTVTIPKLGEDHAHSFSPDWKHDSTSHWHECDCGEKNEIAPHVENGGVVTTEPTETSTGIMTYSCSVCGYVMRTDVIPALIPEHNHTFGTDWKYDSVSHWHECECGEKSDIANHISSDWIVVTPATTDLEGVQIRRCTVCGIELDRETIEKLPNISTGDVAEDVRDTAGTNAGLVQDNTLIENVLTTDDKTEVTEGHSFEIVLEVTDIRDSVPAADVTAASSALRYNEQIGIYVDLSLFKIKDNSERTPIYNTSGRIGITLTVPDSIYASDRTYSIIRVHDGIAENLGGIYDKASRELTFYTDKFSTYAIAYAASNSGTDRPSVPDTPTNPSVPSVPTYPNTPVVPVTPTVTETTVKKEEEVISDEPYVEDVSSAAGIYESYEADNNIHYVMILIFAAAAGIAVIAAKKHFCKKNMK